MLRTVARFQQPARRVLETSSKSFSVLATTSPLSLHGRTCRCGSCSAHAPGCTCSRCQQTRGFVVTSQSQYDIPKTQTAIVFEKSNAPLQVRQDWPVVQPKDLKPGQVLVRLAYSGVCHTDLHIWLGEGPPFVSFPLIGGHEGAGYVAAIGPHTTTKLKIGDPVGVKWLATSCLGCEDCRKGHEPTCEEAQIHGAMIHGSFQQWCVSFADHVTLIPKDLPLDSAAPILCAGVTVYKALKSFGGNVGDTVVIPGAGGGLGHLACQYARAMGYRVIAIDSGDEKRKIVTSYGIRDFIDFKDGNVVDRVRAATDGRGAHGVIVVASNGEAYDNALSFLRPNGSLVMVGVPKDKAVVADIATAVTNSHRIIASYVGNRQDAVEALKVAAYGDVHVKHEVVKLTELEQAFTRLADGTVSGRIVLDCA